LNKILLYWVYYIANNLYQKYIFFAGLAKILERKAISNFVNLLEQDIDEETETSYFQRNNNINPPYADDGSIQHFLLCLKGSTVDNTQKISINYDPAPTKAFRAMTKMNVLILQRRLKLIYFENIFICTNDI